MRMRAKEVIKLEELKVTPRTPAWVTGQLKLPITVEKNRGEKGGLQCRSFRVSIPSESLKYVLTTNNSS